MVLGDIEQRGVTTPLHPLVVTSEMPFGDAGHEPVPTLR